MESNGPESPEFLTLPHAAKRAGVGLKRLRLARDRGELPVYRLGTRWDRVHWPELIEWIRSYAAPRRRRVGEPS
jgi:hypothetical protein